MNEPNVTVIGKITNISGIVLIYSDGDKEKVRIAKVGDEILSTDVIDDTNGSYQIKSLDKNIEFLQNEDLSTPETQPVKDVDELLQPPKPEQEEKKKVAEEPEEPIDEDEQKTLEELTLQASTVSIDPTNNGGGKFLHVRPIGIQEKPIQFDGVLGADGKAIGTNAIGNIGMTKSDHLILQTTRSGGSGILGMEDITSLGITFSKTKFYEKEPDKVFVTYEPESRIFGEPPAIPTPPTPPTGEPSVPSMVKELVSSRVAPTITDAHYDLVKGYNYAIETDLSAAINHLNNNVTSNTLSITIPSNVILYLIPHAGYLNVIEDPPGSGIYKDMHDGNVIYTKEITGDLAKIEIDKTTLTTLHEAAVEEANKIDINLTQLLSNRETLQALQTTANSVSDINLLQTPINNAKYSLEEQILSLEQNAPERATYIERYKILVTLQTVFENQSAELPQLVIKQIDSLLSDNIITYNQLTAAKNASIRAVKNNHLVLYTTTDADVECTVAVDSDVPYTTTQTISIDAVADGIEFGNDGKPTGEVVVSIDHVLDESDPVVPANDAIQINLTVNVNFIDPDNSESHKIAIQLPAALIGIWPPDNSLPADWSYSNGILVRQEVTGVDNLNENLMIKFSKSNFSTISEADLTFKLQFVTTEENIAGDEDILDNNQLTQEVSITKETLNDTIMAKELEKGHGVRWDLLDADALFGSREVGYLNVQSILEQLKIKMDFVNEIYEEGALPGYTNAVNAVFNNSAITINLSSSTAKVITGVTGAVFNNPTTGVFLLDGANLKIFYDNWVTDNTKYNLFVGQAVEQLSTDFIVNVTGKVENNNFDIITDRQVIIDAVAAGVDNFDSSYISSNIQVGLQYVDLPVNVQFTAKDTDASEQFKIIIEIPDISGAEMNFQALGWDNIALKNLTWQLVYDVDDQQTIITTEIPGSYIQSINGIFNENLKIRFDTTALSQLREAEISQFNINVEVQSYETLPADGSDRDFNLIDNVGTVVSEEITIDDLPIDTLYAIEVQNDDDFLTEHESIHLNFKELIDENGENGTKLATSITIELTNDLQDSLIPDIDVQLVKLIWKDLTGTVHEVVGVYDPNEHTNTFTIDDLSGWLAAGRPDLQLVGPKYIAGSYELSKAEVIYDGGGTTESLYENMEVHIGAVASGMTDEGVVVDDLILSKTGAFSVNDEALSYITFNVKGEFLDTDNSENHFIVISLPDSIDDHTLSQLSSGSYWALLEQQVVSTTGGNSQVIYEDQSDVSIDLGNGVRAFFDLTTKSIIIYNIGTSFDGTLTVGFKSDVLESIDNFTPEFMVRAVTQEVRDLLPTDIDAEPELNTKQVFSDVVSFNVQPFIPTINLNELQEDPTTLTIDRIKELVTVGQVKVINIAEFVQMLNGDASNAKIEITLSGDGASGVVLMDHTGHLIQQADGKIILTAAQIADYITSPTDMNIYLLPKQYAHENFVINVTGYNNDIAYPIRIAMPVEVNAVATGVDLVTENLLTAHLIFGTKSVDLTPTDADLTKTNILNNLATLKLTYDLNLADVVDTSQTHSLVIDLRDIFPDFSASELTAVIKQMVLQQAGTDWAFEIVDENYTGLILYNLPETTPAITNFNGTLDILNVDISKIPSSISTLPINLTVLATEKPTVLDSGEYLADNAMLVVANTAHVNLQYVKVLEKQGEHYKLDLTAVLTSIENDVEFIYDPTFFNHNFTRAITIAVNGIDNGSVVHIPGASDLTVINGEIIINGATLQILYDNWYNNKIVTNATITVDTLSNVLGVAQLNPYITISGDNLSPLAEIDAIGTLTREVNYSVNLDPILNTIDNALGATTPDTVTLTLEVNSALNGMYITFPGCATPITVANNSITISGATFQNLYDYWQANRAEQGTHFIKLITDGRVLLASELAITSIAAISSDPEIGTIDLSEATIDGNTIAGVFYGNIHSVDATAALTLLQADLQDFINSSPLDPETAREAFFSGQATISLDFTGLTKDLEIHIPGISEKKVITNGMLTLSEDDLEAFYTAWEQAHTTTEKLTVANLTISQALYSAEPFVTQINYTDLAGITHSGQQIMVNVVPITTTDSYVTYDANFVYDLIDDTDPRLGFTDYVTLNIKLNDLQLRDIDGSENHTLSIELGDMFDELEFSISENSLWQIELNSDGKNILVYGSITSFDPALLTNSDFSVINLVFDKKDLFTKFDENSVPSILDDHIILKIDNQEISTILPHKVTTDYYDIDYGDHTVILENQGQFLYFKITESLDNLAAKILATADLDNDLSFPTAEQITNFFTNYFDSDDVEAATIFITAGLKEYEQSHNYAVTIPNGTRIPLEQVGGSYQFKLTAAQLQQIMLNYNTAKLDENMFYFNKDDFDPTVMLNATATVTVTEVPFEINLETVLTAIQTNIAAAGDDVDTYFEDNIDGLTIDLPDDPTLYPNGASIFISGLNKYCTISNTEITLTKEEFRDYYKSWDAVGADQTDIQTITINYLAPTTEAQPVTVTVDKAAPDVYESTATAVAVEPVIGDIDLPDHFVTLNLTDALRVLQQQLTQYVAEDPSRTIDSFFYNVAINLNLVLTGIANGTEITIPGVSNFTQNTNGLLISTAMLDLKNLIVEAGFDPQNGSLDYFNSHPTQTVIELTGIADDININFAGVTDDDGNLVQFIVQGGKIIINQEYISDVYQSWASSLSYYNATTPFEFIADPIPTGIATRDGIVTLSGDDLLSLYNYWIDSNEDVIVTIKPKQHTDNDFITQVTLNIGDTSSIPIYSTAQTFIEVTSLASGIDEYNSYIKIADRSIDVDYGPNANQIGELGHLKLTVHVEYHNDTDSTRVIEIQIPKTHDFAFNFNQDVNADWYYVTTGDSETGLLRYVGDFNKDPITGRIIIDSNINLTFSTMQLARYIDQSYVDGYQGNKINIENVFNEPFILQAQTATDSGNVKLQNLTPVEPELAVYNIGFNKVLDWLDFGNILDSWNGGVDNNIEINFDPLKLPPETINIYYLDPNDETKVLTKELSVDPIYDNGVVISYRLTISADDVATWKTYYTGLDSDPELQAAVGRLMIGLDLDGVVGGDTDPTKIISIIYNNGADTYIPTIGDIIDIPQIQFETAGTYEYILDFTSIFTNISEVQNGMTITICGDTNNEGEPLEQPEIISGTTVYIPGSDQYVMYTIDGDTHANITLTKGQLTAWYNHWNSLTGTEQIDAAKLVMARLNDWNDGDNRVKISVPDANPQPYDTLMTEVVAADQIKIPMYDQADINNNSTAYMKDAAVEYSLKKVLDAIINALVKNDGITGSLPGTKYQGTIDNTVLNNILTQGIGGTEASCLNFIFYSKDGITLSRQEPSVMFFQQELDQEQVGTAGYYGPRPEPKVPYFILSKLVTDYFEDLKESEANGATVDLTKYSAYIIPYEGNDIDFKFSVQLDIKDNTEDSENITSLMIDDGIPVIVTKDIGVANETITDIIDTVNNFALDITNINVNDTMHTDKIDNYLHTIAKYNYSGPADADLEATFGLHVKFQAKVQDDDSIPKITKIYIQLPIDRILISDLSHLSDYVRVTTPGWTTQIINNRVTVVWDSSTAPGGKITSIDQTLQLKADLSILKQITNSDLTIKVDYDSSLQQDLYLYSGTAGNSTTTFTQDDAFSNVLNKVEDLVQLDTSNGIINTAVFNEGGILEALDQGGTDTTLTGSAHDDILIGRSGNDTLNGGDGDDIIFTGTGKDTVDAGAGNDVIYGDLGNSNNWETTLTATQVYSPPATPINNLEDLTPDISLGSEIRYTVGDSVTFNTYNVTQQVATYEIDRARSSRTWSLSVPNRYIQVEVIDYFLGFIPIGSHWETQPNPEWTAMYNAINDKLSDVEDMTSGSGVTDAIEAELANDKIVFAGNDIDQHDNITAAMGYGGGYVHITGSLDTYDTWEYGSSSTYLQEGYTPFPGNDDDYTVDGFDRVTGDDPVSTHPVTDYDTIIPGEGQDRIYAGSNGSVIDLANDTAQDIVTYTYKDTTPTTSVFDIITGFGDEDKLDLTQLFDTIAPDANETARKNMIQVAKATNLGADEMIPDDDVPATAVFVQYTDGQGDPQQLQIAILENITWDGTPDWVKEHTIVSEQTPGHDYLG